ncbi:MAG: hypothetical protein IJD52_01225 [Alphaproteobacteria bacterium]|nr:hypothetical protein [Alphaproteobacteria bacterium]
MKKLSMFALCAALTVPAFAEDMAEKSPAAFPSGLEFGVGASITSGLNGFVGYANKDFESFWLKRFGVRFEFADTRPIQSAVDNLVESLMDDGIDIGDGVVIDNGKLDAKHLATLVDFYPFGNTWFFGGWRITGGYFWGDMRMDADLTGEIPGLDDAKQYFDLAGTHFYYDGNDVSGTASLDWQYHGPYVGTGFDLGLFAGFKIYMDAGVVFTNRPAQIELDVPIDNLYIYNTASNTWSPVTLPELEDAKTQALKEANDELHDYKFYPMVKLGFMYRF